MIGYKVIPRVRSIFVGVYNRGACPCASRCTGVHVWPMMFDHSVEVEPESRYVVRLSMESALPAENCALRPVETVWGGRGMEIATTERPGLKFRFISAEKPDLRFSVTCGQIPVIYYVLLKFEPSCHHVICLLRVYNRE